MAGKRSDGDGALRKRPNGLWECTMMVGHQEDGKHKYKSFYGKTQKEVKDKAAAYKRDVAAGLYVDKNLTFKEWADQWYEGYRDSVSPRPCRHRNDPALPTRSRGNPAISRR